MNKIVAVSAAAAVPIIAPELPAAASEVNDPIFAAIDAYSRADAACTAVDGDIPDDLGDRRGDAFHSVMRTCPLTPAGLVALTTWSREQSIRHMEDGSMLYADDNYALLATIDDAARGMSGLQPWSPPARPTSDALTLVKSCRNGDRRWDILADKITAVEEDEKIVDQYGRRPCQLIAWRDYTAICRSELERVRDEFIAAGIPANVVRTEYRAAKKRERELERAGQEWDRQVGLTEARKEFEDCRRETIAAWEALGQVRVTSVSDAAAIMGVLQERMNKYDELSDDWEVAAFKNASRFLVRTAA